MSKYEDFKIPPLGVGQNWIDVTDDREADTVYTNDTNRPILVSVGTSADHDDTHYNYLKVDGIIVGELYYNSDSGTSEGTSTVVVPTNSTYELTDVRGIRFWCELR